jgi:protein gp37
MQAIGKTKIETATHVWNPVVGCDRLAVKGTCGQSSYTCWAAQYMKRFWEVWLKSEKQWCKKKYHSNNDYFWQASCDVIGERLKKFNPVYLTSQRFKRFPVKKSIIAVGWMSDIFYWKPAWIQSIIQSIANDNLRRSAEGKPYHVFQFLTKSPQVYLDYNWPRNCWLGVTATHYSELKFHVNTLAQAKIKTPCFLYLEPLLGPVGLKKEWFDVGPFKWVVAGGVTGHDSFPAHPDTFPKLLEQCNKIGIEFFFKSWGDWISRSQASQETKDWHLEHPRFSHYWGNDEGSIWVGKKRTGHLIDGKEYRQWPKEMIL